MTETLQMAAVAVCPYCGSADHHHWPEGCIGLLSADIAILSRELTGPNRKPCAGCINWAAGNGVRHVSAGHELSLNPRPNGMRGTVPPAGASMPASLARKYAGGLIHFTEERFRSAFASSTVAMGLLSLEGTFLEVNDACCRMTCTSREELLGKDFSTIIDPDELAVADQEFLSLAQGAIPSLLAEHRFLLRDGRVGRARIGATLVPGNNGAVSYVLFFADDKTVARSAQDALRFSPGNLLYHERELQWKDGRIIHVIEDAIGTFNEEGEIEIQDCLIEDSERQLQERARSKQAEERAWSTLEFEVFA